MEAKSLYRKAFWLFFSAIALFLITAFGVAALWVAIPVVPVGLIVALLSLFCAWVLCLHPESLDEKIGTRRAAELADEAWKFFLRSNPVGCLVWLLSDNKQEK